MGHIFCCGGGGAGATGKSTEAGQGQRAETPGGRGTGSTLTPSNLHGFASNDLVVGREWSSLESLATFQKVGKTLHSRVSSLAQPMDPFTRCPEQQPGIICSLLQWEFTSTVE